jgi:hypothetical protein
MWDLISKNRANWTAPAVAVISNNVLNAGFAQSVTAIKNSRNSITFCRVLFKTDAAINIKDFFFF